MTSLSPQPEILISSLGTTRAAVGSAEAQRVIDLDLNLSVARAAHAAGTRVYVLISSTGANAKSMFAYPKMKGELEDAVKQIGFDTVVVLRPGLIMGHREEARYAESAIKMCANGLIRLFGHAATDFWAQDSDLIAKAAVVAGLKSKSGEHETLTTTPVDKSFVPLSQSDILRLGRDVWPTVTKET